jgi:hypothetical protein
MKNGKLVLDHVRVSVTAKLLPKARSRAATKTHAQTRDRYAKVLAFIEQHGRMTNAQAANIGGWKQPGYHLRKLQERGLIQHTEYGTWRWKCQACGKVPRHVSECDCLSCVMD